MAVAREHRKRSLERRDVLVRAAMEVAAERGMAGVTHRAVTERAGLPLAAVSYFWTSIDDLADEALRTLVAVHAATLGTLAASFAVGDAAGDPEEISAAIAAAIAPRIPETLAQFEAFLAAARTPHLREAVGEAIGAFRRVATTALGAAGLPDPEAAAPAFLALADGHALHVLATGRSGSEAQAELRDGFRALFAGYLALAAE